jgi:type I restriction enzyme S subunit
MNRELLLQHFDRISEAPDAIPRLRRFILDLAVRGKLVEQDPCDEPAAELIKQISAKRLTLVKSGSFKSPKAIDNRKGVDLIDSIPNSWEWVYANDLWGFENGDRGKNYPSRDQFVPEGIPFVNAGHLVGGKVVMDDMNFITPTTFQKLGGGKLKNGDQIYCLRGSLGKHAIYNYDFNAAIASSLVILRPVEPQTVPFLTLYFDSTAAMETLRRFDNGTAQPNLSSENLRKFKIPLPPLAEQHRIVAKVDELMALCDQLEAERNKREARRDRLVASSLNRISTTTAEEAKDAARFHINHLPRLTTRTEHIKQLRQTILNLAVRGRLVPQDPNDEPAAELLKRIQAEKIRLVKEGVQKKDAVLPALDLNQAPFTLPVGWSWARFPELGKFGRGKSKHRPRNDSALFSDGTHLLVQTGDVARSQGVITTYTSKYNDAGLAQSMKWPAGSLCITIAANIADSGILSFDACFPDSVVGFIPASMIPNARYFEYFVRTAKANLLAFAPATAQKNINLEILNSVMIPLPPLAEQHLIVAKVDELMGLCDQLEASLNTTEADSRRLLEAVLRDALEPSAVAA